MSARRPSRGSSHSELLTLGAQACGLRVEEELNENLDYLNGIAGHELAVMEVR